MPAWLLVRTCGHVAAGGLHALLNLLMAALHSASVARVEAAEARWAASAPFSEARVAAEEARGGVSKLTHGGGCDDSCAHGCGGGAC